MITLIEDLKGQKGKEGVWLFKLRLLIEDGGKTRNFLSLGWRYYEESGEVLPPSTKIGKGYIKTTQIDGDFLADLAVKVRETLAPPDEAQKFAEEVWAGYLETRAEMDLDEALVDINAVPDKNRHQWALALMLRIAANPGAHGEVGG